MAILPAKRVVSGGGGSPTRPTQTSGRNGLTAAPGVTMTSGINAMGSPAALGTTNAAIDELIVSFGGFTSTRHMVFDVLNATDSTDIVKDFHFHCQQNVAYVWRFPVRVASGKALTIRCASTSALPTAVSAHGVSSDVPETATKVQAISAYGGGAPTTSGVVVTAGGGWTAIGGALPNAAKGGIITLGINNVSTGRTASAYTVEVSVDGGTTTVVSFTAYQFTTGSVTMPMLFWLAMAAGTQLHLRIVPSVANSDTFNVNIHPIY